MVLLSKQVTLEMKYKNILTYLEKNQSFTTKEMLSFYNYNSFIKKKTNIGSAQYY